MIRTSALLFALLLAFAAPLRAQAPAAAATPLPSSLVPNADAGLGIPARAAARPDRMRGMAIGMAIGCAVFGTWAAVENKQYDGPVTAGVIGCAWGSVIGGIFGFAWLGGR